MREIEEQYMKELLPKKEIPYPENYEVYIRQILEKLFDNEDENEKTDNL